jgi:hypothetical protein
MAARAALLLALTLLLSGCAGGAGSSSTAIRPSPQVDQNAGAVSGLVLDDEFLPLEGAQVAILSKVPPGPHQIAAAAIGYEPSVVNVLVVVGEVTEVEILLGAIPVARPWIQTLHHTGFIGIGVGLVRTATCQQCGTNATSYFMFGGFPDDYQGIVVEARWHTNDWLGFDLNARPPANQMWYRTRSTSPVHFYAERCASYEGAPTFGRNPMPCNEEEVTASQGSATSHAHLETWYIGQFQQETHLLDPVCQTPTGPLPGYQAGCYGLGLATDLRWETWLSIFHLELPPNPETYSSLPDG